MYILQLLLHTNPSPSNDIHYVMCTPLSYEELDQLNKND